MLGNTAPKERSQRLRVAGDTVPNLTGSGIEPQTSGTNSVVLNTELIGWGKTKKRFLKMHRKIHLKLQQKTYAVNPNPMWYNEKNTKK